MSVNAPEAKRAAFVAQLAAIPLAQRVYVDESGMDERDDYGYGWCERGKRFEAQRVWAASRTGQHERLQEELFPLQLSHDCSVLRVTTPCPFSVEGARNIARCLKPG